jgi:hypothetical protein
MGRLDERMDALHQAGSGASEPEAGAPVGPSAEEEATLLSIRGESAPVTAVPTPREEPPPKLPPLEGLVGRIPPGVRDALDELFRAKFTLVRRVPPSALK